MNSRDFDKAHKPSDEARYALHWRQKNAPREQCMWIDKMITHGQEKERSWQSGRILSRQKKWSRHHHRPNNIKPAPRSMTSDLNVADTRLRLFENQYNSGKISFGDLNAARVKLESLSRLLEDRKHLPVPVGESYGDHTKEEKILMVRYDLTSKDLARFNSYLEIPEDTSERDFEDVDSTVDVLVDHAVCRVLGDVVQGEYIPKEDTPMIVPAPSEALKSFKGFAQLPSGLWIPKRMLDWRIYKEVEKAVPERAVKSSKGSSPRSSKSEARKRHPGSRFRY